MTETQGFFTRSRGIKPESPSILTASDIELPTRFRLWAASKGFNQADRDRILRAVLEP